MSENGNKEEQKLARLPCGCQLPPDKVKDNLHVVLQPEFNLALYQCKACKLVQFVCPMSAIDSGQSRIIVAN